MRTGSAEITGFDAVSLQPNAGSQGEYTGLLVIKRYLERSGQSERDICLIPSSAHGTNPASAVLAGLRVVVVGCDENGNVDVEDLRAKAAQLADRLAALMVTYPSTHGVFEEAIVDICQIVHDHGGQVYLDGAQSQRASGCLPAREITGPMSTISAPQGNSASRMAVADRECRADRRQVPRHRSFPTTLWSRASIPPPPAMSRSAACRPPRGEISASILPISWAYITR
ncbi:MAG: hypothetical protein R3D03_13325 [Geminicoccaceae bacterium]